jgi:hypothetical protein
MCKVVKKLYNVLLPCTTLQGNFMTSHQKNTNENTQFTGNTSSSDESIEMASCANRELPRANERRRNELSFTIKSVRVEGKMRDVFNVEKVCKIEKCENRSFYSVDFSSVASSSRMIKESLENESQALSFTIIVFEIRYVSNYLSSLKDCLNAIFLIHRVGLQTQ